MIYQPSSDLIDNNHVCVSQHLILQSCFLFTQILPIAHASGNRKRIRIVNPQGVDLKGYIARVERAETRYRK